MFVSATACWLSSVFKFAAYLNSKCVLSTPHTPRHERILHTTLPDLAVRASQHAPCLDHPHIPTPAPSNSTTTYQPRATLETPERELHYLSPKVYYLHRSS